MWKKVRALREQLGAAQAKEHITERSALRKVAEEMVKLKTSAQSLSESLAQSQEKALAGGSTRSASWTRRRWPTRRASSFYSFQVNNTVEDLRV